MARLEEGLLISENRARRCRRTLDPDSFQRCVSGFAQPIREQAAQLLV
jgi:hypothetical protein